MQWQINGVKMINSEHSDEVETVGTVLANILLLYSSIVFIALLAFNLYY
jgi:hypothetical protein